MKIIVVDDEYRALEIFFKQNINNSNYDFIYFNDNEDAILEYVKSHNIDGALLDIKMPNISGIDLAKKLIKIDKNIKIIYITGFNYKIEDIPSVLKDNVLDIIYKPYTQLSLKNGLNKIKNIKNKMSITMFPYFNCYLNGELIKFTSSKSKELFALIIVFRGKMLTMNSIITHLWPDKNIELSKKLYRDAIWRLRKTLKDIDFNCVKFLRASVFLDTSNIECDYWKYLDNKSLKIPENGFLVDYEWSIDYELEF